jgi:hypothetical protein
MKIIEFIYTCWPIWLLVAVFIEILAGLKGFGRIFESLGAATAGIGSPEMAAYKKRGRALGRLHILSGFMCMLVLIAMIYHGYLYLIK